MWGSTVAFLKNTVDCDSVSNLVFFFLFFCYDFFKIIFVNFIFLILSWVRIQLCNLFFFKTLQIAVVFPHIVFFLFFYYDFFQIYLCRFYFFNIELIENYNYNKTKSCGDSTVAFLTKHYGLLHASLHGFFFVMIFSKIFFVDFFLILSW